jgi:tripartite-type tricarboxylate transporter receptor subunit TctC
MVNIRRRAAAAALGAGMTAIAPAALAQPYPAKPVRIVVGFAPGGSTDIVARTTAQRLAEAWGQPVVVENRPGASGMIGAELVSKAPPDGYTLLASPQTSMAVAPNIFPKIPYHPVRDFAAITIPAAAPMLLVVHPSLPVHRFADFIALAKARPGALNYGSGGIGTGPHMAGELIRTITGIAITHVPYKGEGPAITDVIGGQISFVIGTMPAVIGHVNNKRLRGIAVTSAQRTRLAPEYPTIAESGMPGFDAAIWIGLFGPAAMPRDLVNRVQTDVARLLTPVEAREKLAQQGVEPVANTPDQFSAFLKEELAKWGKVVKEANVRAD